MCEGVKKWSKNLLYERALLKPTVAHLIASLEPGFSA